jgi:hypothetical protein
MSDIKKFIDFIYKNIYYFLFFVIGIHYLYWISGISDSTKFKTLLSIYGTLSITLSIYNMYTSSITQYATTINSQISYLNQLFQNITQTTSSFFANNKDMRYYYDELFNGIKHSDDTTRNLNSEQIISTNILINVDALINYIDSFKITSGGKVNFQVKVMEEKLIKLLAQFMKSKIFVENWKKFKKLFALKWTKNYMSLYFNQ